METLLSLLNFWSCIWYSQALSLVISKLFTNILQILLIVVLFTPVYQFFLLVTIILVGSIVRE